MVSRYQKYLLKLAEHQYHYRLYTAQSIEEIMFVPKIEIVRVIDDLNANRQYEVFSFNVL